MNVANLINTMKGRNVTIAYMTRSGEPECKMQLENPKKVTVIEVLRDNGTDILFFESEGQLYHFTAKDILSFN